MILPAFPSELWDKVIDNVALQDDGQHSSVKACSLVRKDFLPRARSHIFHKITLSYHDEAQKFLDILEMSLHIGAYVVRLNLLEGRQFDHHERLWFSEALPRLARCLTNVRHLHLRFMVWNWLSTVSRPSLLNGFQLVTLISLTACIVPGFPVFQEIVASFPNLKELCDPPDFGPVPFDKSVKYLPPRGLESITSTHWNDLTPWLLHNKSSLPIQKLVIRFLGEQDFPYIQSLLSVFGYQMKTLEIDFRIPGPYVDSDSQRIFSAVSSLQTLIIDGLFIYARSSDSPRLMWLIPFLSRITSTSLERIEFRFWMDSPEELDCIDWKALDNVFGRREWKESLERITFRILGTFSSRPAEAEGIRERLSETRNRGLLEFDLTAVDAPENW